MVFVVNGKEMTSEEYKEYRKKENEKEFQRVEYGIKNHNPYLNIELSLITEEEFDELIKKYYRIVDLVDEFMLDEDKNDEIYTEFAYKQGLMVNYSLSSNPAMDSWCYDVIFKHNHLFYIAHRWDTN